MCVNFVSMTIEVLQHSMATSLIISFDSFGDILPVTVLEGLRITMRNIDVLSRSEYLDVKLERTPKSENFPRSHRRCSDSNRLSHCGHQKNVTEGTSLPLGTI